MSEYKSLKISELIKELERCKKEYGDVPVIMSRDDEGNGFSTIEKDYSFNFSNGLLTLYPDVSYLEKDDVKGYVYDDSEEDNEFLDELFPDED